MVFATESLIILVLVYVSLWHDAPVSKYSQSAATYGIGTFDDEVDWTRHPCKRECRDNTKPLTCRYGFTVENYSSMSKACYDCPRNVSDCFRPHCIPADGNNDRMVLVANRQLPGPSIEVCEGDRIIVDVTNRLIAEPTTIHWHGEHQRGSPFMDGVPMISQCPIASGDSFRYDFKANNPGTMFWHAHSGLQRSDGLFGALIVRRAPSKNPHVQLYDNDEHLIILNEWSKFVGSKAMVLQGENRVPTPTHALFINGYGPYESDNPKTAMIPRHVFRVKRNSRHRFRLINSGSHICMFYITVDRHPLLVISTDGADVKPVEADAIRLNSGERYDFVIKADQPVGNYWIRVMGDVSCSTRKVHQEAILRYEGAPETDPTEPIGYGIGFEPGKRMLNPFEQGSETKGAMCISCSLRSVEPDDLSLQPTTDYKYYLPYDFYIPNEIPDYENSHNRELTAMINGRSFEYPKVSLQTQPDLIKPGDFCDLTKIECSLERCACPHVLSFKLNSTVELILIDQGEHNSYENIEPQFKLSHPMHLHGFYYRVVAMEKLDNMILVEEVKALDLTGKIHRNLKNAPKKDVLNVPSGGYAIIRFRADNPGYWFFHCHYEKHSHSGLAMVFKVGEHEDFPAVPKDFPKCQQHL